MQTSPASKVGNQAIVIGGSIAGLFATRVLSDYFEAVTLIERDRIEPEPIVHKSVPQARHVHVLLGKGLEIASQLFPDLVNSLKASGAIELDFGADVRWHHYGDYKVKCPGTVTVLSQTRPLLEFQIRQRVTQLANVTVLWEQSVEALLTNPDRWQVNGVRLKSKAQAEQTETLTADLVVDATGRNSAAPRWLESLGYQKPQETEVVVGVGYTSRLYKRRATDFEPCKGCIVSADPPKGTRGGVVAPIEGDRWLVTLIGYLGDHPPVDGPGFLDYARSLPAPDIYNHIAQSEAISEPIPHRFPSSLRRHYEKLLRIPDGYLVTGDALCSFNPIFGQGMTVAALESQTLGQCLRESPKNLQGLSRRFFTQVADLLDTPWRMVIGEDFRYPEVMGNRTLQTTLMNWYISKIYKAAHHDALVQNAFINVMHMLDSPAILLRPNLLRHILR